MLVAVALTVYAILASVGAASRYCDRDLPSALQSIAYGLGWGLTAPIGLAFVLVAGVAGVVAGLVDRFRGR